MLVLENATLVNLTNGGTMPGHHVVAEGDLICGVNDRPIKANDSERISLKGRCLLLGLVDAHFHSTLTEINPANSRDLPSALIAARTGKLLRQAPRFR